MVRAQALLIDHLGIERLFAVVGGSMGSMQVLQWAALLPDRLFAAVPSATAARHSAQNIAFHEVGHQAIMADPDWHHGCYAEHVSRSVKGLAVARMTAHITYLSEMALHNKFGRRLQDRGALPWLRCGFSGRELSAPSRQHLRRSFRRQQLPPLHHPYDGLFRSGGRLRRGASACASAAAGSGSA